MILWVYIGAVAVIFAIFAVAARLLLQADTGCHAAERDVWGDLASLIRVTAAYAAIRLRARIPVVRTASPDGTAPDHPLSGAVPLEEEHPGLAWVRDLNARLDSGNYTPRRHTPPAVTGLTGEMPALTGGERS